MAQSLKIDPAERARNFNKATRQYKQVVASKTGAVSTVVSFEVPKSRLLAGLFVEVKATLNAIHASATTYTPHEDAPFNFIDRLQVDMNNGFMPYNISGESLYMHNISNRGADTMAIARSGRGSVVQGNVSSASTGTDNVVRIFAKLPLSVNERDPIGLVMMNADDILCNVNVTLGALADLAPAASGYTFAVSAITVTLYSETFSIPSIAEAVPDISVVKLVNEKTESIIAGENTIKLPASNIYRKIGFSLRNATPARVAETGITGTIDLILDQTDYPYRFNTTELAAINNEVYRGDLPNGTYIIDFASLSQLINLAGGRDYIDTDGVTEYWLKFTSAAAGTLQIWYETLATVQLEG